MKRWRCHRPVDAAHNVRVRRRPWRREHALHDFQWPRPGDLPRIHADTLGMQNVTVEGNSVLGAPAGARAIAVFGDGTEAFAAPQMDVWQWPGGPAVPSDPDTAIASFFVERVARPQLAVLQKVCTPSPQLQLVPHSDCTRKRIRTGVVNTSTLAHSHAACAQAETCPWRRVYPACMYTLSPLGTGTPRSYLGGTQTPGHACIPPWHTTAPL